MVGTPLLQRRMSQPSIVIDPKAIVKELRLTPIIEDLNELKLASTLKKFKDDSVLIQSSSKKVQHESQI
jgi:hypothetical protein